MINFWGKCLEIEGKNLTSLMKCLESRNRTKKLKTRVCSKIDLGFWVLEIGGNQRNQRNYVKTNRLLKIC